MAYTLTEENREETVSRDGQEVVRTLRVEPYTERFTVMQELLGGVSVVGGRFTRTLPARDPWMPWLFCNSIKMTPVEILNSPGSTTNAAQLAIRNYSASCRLVVTYKSLDRDESTNDEKTLASEAWTYGSTSLTLPNAFFKWPDEKLLLRTDVALTKVIPTLDYTVTRHYCPTVPFTAISRLTGTINKSAFQMPFYLWPKETLRFEGVDISRKYTIGATSAATGIPFFELSYKFAVNTTYDQCGPDNDSATTRRTHAGWNRMFNPEKGYYAYPQSVGTAVSTTVYQLDEDVHTQTIGGVSYSGFALLFQTGAA